MKSLRIAMILCAALAASTFAEEVVLNPDGSGHYPNIQAAIDAVSPGSTIWLADGVWQGAGNHSLDFGGKILVIRSISDSPEDCRFDLSAGGIRAFDFHSDESNACQVRGVKIHGSHGLSFGGAVRINMGSPRFENCHFENNGVKTAGGAFYIQSSAAEIANCRFHSNYAGQSGGAVSLAQESQAIVEACIFDSNQADMMGGAMEMYDSLSNVFDCVFRGNTAGSWAGGALHMENSWSEVSNCTFAENFCASGSAISSEYSDFMIHRCIFTAGNSPPFATSVGPLYEMTCCDLWGNTGGDYTGAIAGYLGSDGNFSEDPQFCGSLGTGDFRLQSDSPCAIGNAYCPESLIGALDVDCGIESTELSTWSRVKSLY